MKLKQKYGQYSFGIMLFFAVLLIDRLSKNWVLKEIAYQPKPILPFVNFVYVENYGAVFGLFSNSNLNFALISISSIIVIIVMLIVFLKKIPIIPTSLIIGGAIGNIWDRYLYGYVVDFIKVGNFYVFNFADAAICIGAFLLLLNLFLEEKKNSNSSKKTTG